MGGKLERLRRAAGAAGMTSRIVASFVAHKPSHAKAGRLKRMEPSEAFPHLANAAVCAPPALDDAQIGIF
jgi:hypothetical protein